MKNSLLTVVTALVFVFACNAQSSKSKSVVMKSVCELSGNTLTWQMISYSLSKAKNKVEVLAKEEMRADSALYQAQLPEGNPIGAVIYNCGGILINNGWIRILGSGSKKLDRSLPQWNKGKSFANYGEVASYLLVADDALGGLFAINKGGLDKSNPDKIYYFGPNSLSWTFVGFNYTQFLNFCFSGDIKNFYEEFQWKGCDAEVQKLKPNEVISCYPLIWTRNGKELMQCNRKVVSIQKQWSMYQGEAVKSVSKPQNNLAEIKKSNP